MSSDGAHLWHQVDDIPALEATGMDCHQIAHNSASMVVKEVLEDGFFHADPHPAKPWCCLER